MTFGKSPHPEWLVDSKRTTGGLFECSRDNDRAVVGHSDEPAIECRVEVWREQDAVEDIEALSVARAIGPGLDGSRAGVGAGRDR